MAASTATEPGVIPYHNIIASEAVNLATLIPFPDLKDRTVLITGGASGLGLAMAITLASHGANIVIGDVNTSAGEKLIAHLRSTTSNPNHHYVHLDVTSWTSQVAFFRTAASLSPHSGIDCVIANAGIADPVENETFVSTDYVNATNPPEPRFKTSRVNLDGVLFTSTLAMSYLQHNPSSQPCSTHTSPGPRDRHLLLVSSIAGLAAFPTQPLYCASKHGVVGLFRSLRITAPITNGVRINLICPYFVDTPILGPLGAVVLAGGNMAKIEDVACAVTRLVADRSIIGRALVIGGRGSKQVARMVGLDAVQEDQAIWDVLGDDFRQTEVFTRRIMAVTNLVAAARGWTGILVDVGARILAPIRRILGY